MSLIAWYPLNGDLKDYSGNENHLQYLYNNGKLNINNSGKIGKCYDRKVNEDGADRFNSKKNIHLKNSFTMCCWAYVTSAGTSANGLITNHTHQKNAGAGITVKQASDTDYRISCNTGTGTDRTYSSYYGTSNIKDKWSHLIVRYDKTNNELSLWVNGNIEHSRGYNMLCVEDPIQIFSWSIGNDNGGYLPACRLNDVRIYDHALSVKEIKEIAKGKILHYTFDHFVEPTINLLRNPDGKSVIGPYTQSGWDTSLNSGALQIDLWSQGYNGGVTSANTGYHARWVYEGMDGPKDPCMLFQNENVQFGLGNRWMGISSSAFLNNTLIKEGDILTLSWYQKVDRVNKGANVGIYYHSKSRGAQTFADASRTILSANINTWERCSFQITVTSDWDLTKDAPLYVYGYVDEGIQGKLWVDNLQVEVKDHVTPFVVGERKYNIIRDKSGFGNDGTIELEASPAWTQDGMIGKGYYRFLGNNIIKTKQLFFDNVNQCWTVCGWVMTEDVTIKNQIFNNFNLSNKIIQDITKKPLLYINNGSNDAYVYGPELTNNIWYHIVYVFDTTNRIMDIYINGELYARSNMWNSSKIPAGFANETVFGMDLLGGMDDIRIYATVLSADDIRSIYQSRMSIDDKANLYVNEINEYENIFHPNNIFKYLTKDMQNTKPNYKFIDGRLTFELNPIDFYSNSIYEKVLQSEFKPNTVYEISITMKHDSFHNNNFVAGGFSLHYTDGHVSTYITNVGGTGWVTKKLITNSTKSVSHITIYYYVNEPVKYDIMRSYIREYKPQASISSKGILTTNIIEDRIGITDGMISWYRLEDDVRDYCIANYHGKIIGTLNNTAIDGRRCYHFTRDASFPHIQLPVKAFQNIQDFTISYWWYPDTSFADTYVFSGADSAAKNNVILIGNSRNSFEIWIDNIMSPLIPIPNIVLNKWAHYTIIRSKNEILLYIDGIFISKISFIENIITVNGYLLLGQEQDSVGGSFDINQALVGGLADFRIYNKALSADEVLLLYETTSLSNNGLIKNHFNNTYIKGKVIEL